MNQKQKRLHVFAYATVAALLAAACQPDSPGAALFAASGSPLPHINNSSMAMPVSVNATLTANECSNNPGPQITLGGGVTLGGFGVAMAFKNNIKGTHEYETLNTVRATVQPVGEGVVIPKQPVLGGAGGNPFIWIQFTDETGAAMTEEIFVGRCVQGSTWHAKGPALTRAAGYAEFEVSSCENSPGPFINLGTGMALGGMNARIIFRNNDNPVGGPHDNDETVRKVVIIPAGLSFTFPKQPVQGGVGGNPWIFGNFTDGGGADLGSETMLGRCEQLSKDLST